MFEGRGFCGGLFGKSPPHPPKTPQTKGIGTQGRKCEQRASFFCAVAGSFRAPVLQYRFWFVPRSLVDFFEASPYGVFADGGGGVKMHGTRRLRDVLAAQNGYVPRVSAFAAPPPGGAHPRRVALVARRNARNLLPAVFFLPSFFFWAYMGKRKSGSNRVCFLFGGLPTPHPPLPRSPFSHRRRLRLVRYFNFVRSRINGWHIFEICCREHGVW